MDIESQGSSFTLGGEPITAVNLSDHNKFQYITDPMYNQPEQPDTLPKIFSMNTLFSDSTFDQLIQAIKATIKAQIYQRSQCSFKEDLTALKSQLLKLVSFIDDLNSTGSEFHESLLERATKKLHTSLDQKLVRLRKHRDTLLNTTKFPKEADENLEAYVEHFHSLRSFDFKTQTKDLLHSMSIPFTIIQQEIDKVRSYLQKLQSKVVVDTGFIDLIKTCPPETASIPNFFEDSETIRSVTVSPNGQYIAAGSRNGVLEIWLGYEARFWRVEEAHQGFINTLCFSADSEIIASGGADKSICIKNVYEKATIHRIADAHDTTVLCVKFCPKGDFLCSASKDPTLKIWRTSDFRLYALVPDAHRESIFSTVFVNQGKMLITSSADETVRFWDIPRRKQIKVINAVSRLDINSVTISPKEKLLGAASRDKSITVWYLPTQRILRNFDKAHEDAVFSVRFFTQERILISNSAREDKSIKFWNVYSGEQIKAFRNHIHTVWNGALEICPEKRWVVVEDKEKSVTIIRYEFDASSESEIIKNKIAGNFK